MALALCPAVPSDADETSMVMMVSGVNEDEEAVLLEGAIPPVLEVYEPLTIMPEPSKRKAIVAETVALNIAAKALGTTLTTDRKVGRAAVPWHLC